MDERTTKINDHTTLIDYGLLGIKRVGAVFLVQAGKSCLIDTYTDWQGLARQFYPSYTTDPQLQIYLGSKVIVQEIPSALFNDTSEPARAALLRLWRACFRKKKPTVVVVINGAALNTDSPESLKKQAQTIRGKINILSLSHILMTFRIVKKLRQDSHTFFRYFSQFFAVYFLIDIL